MDRLEAMSMFLAAVENGSLSAAARQMRVPVATLSRKVAELEALLGTQLLTRTTRKLTLTDAGVTYAAASRHILELVNDAQREAAGEFTMPTGELVITAPLLFGRLHVLPIIVDFLALYPAINVRLALGDHIANLVDDGIDMAVRIGALPDSGMIATRVGSMRLVICAGRTEAEALHRDRLSHVGSALALPSSRQAGTNRDTDRAATRDDDRGCPGRGNPRPWLRAPALLPGLGGVADRKAGLGARSLRTGASAHSSRPCLPRPDAAEDARLHRLRGATLA